MRVRDIEERSIVIPVDIYGRLMELEKPVPAVFLAYLKLKWHAIVKQDCQMHKVVPGLMAAMEQAGLIKVDREIVILDPQGHTPGKAPRYSFQMKTPKMRNLDGVKQVRQCFESVLREMSGVIPESNSFYRYMIKVDKILSLEKDGGGRMFTVQDVCDAVEWTYKQRDWKGALPHLNFLMDDMLGKVMMRRKNGGGTTYSPGKTTTEIYSALGQAMEQIAQGSIKDLAELVGQRFYDPAINGYRLYTEADVRKIGEAFGSPARMAIILDQVGSSGGDWETLLDANAIGYLEYAAKV